MENIYHVWLLIAITIILAAFIGYKLAMGSNRKTKIKRCVHFSASTPTGRLFTGKYYFRGHKPEHEIRAEIQHRLNARGYYLAEHIDLIHIANFDWPDKFDFVLSHPKP